MDYPEEQTEIVRGLISQVPERNVWVPALWYLEVGNVLQTGLRRRRIDIAFRNKTLADLSGWTLQVDATAPDFAWSDAVQLSDRHRLTLYDAVYLELALRLRLPLATLDRALRLAADAEGAALLGL